MDPERRGELEDLEQLGLRRAQLDRPPDVDPRARLVEVRAGGVDRDEQELLDLRVEVTPVPEGDAENFRYAAKNSGSSSRSWSQTGLQTPRSAMYSAFTAPGGRWSTRGSSWILAGSGELEGDALGHVRDGGNRRVTSGSCPGTTVRPGSAPSCLMVSKPRYISSRSASTPKGRACSSSSYRWTASEVSTSRPDAVSTSRICWPGECPPTSRALSPGAISVAPP